MPRILPVSVLVSGEGTTLDGLAEAVAGGHLAARIGLVVSDRPHAPAIERARLRGLASAVLPYRGADPVRWADALTRSLEDVGTELVVLAGFLSILPDRFVTRWSGRAINLHPSLLPSYGGPGMYGLKVHEAVLRNGDAETGATIHWVTRDVDHGPVLVQQRMPVEPGDTAESLRARLRPVEQRLLIDTIRRFADGEWALPYPLPEDPVRPRENRGAAP